MVALTGFTRGSYPTRSSGFDGQRSINLYPERSESGISKSAMMLLGTPGLRPWLLLEGIVTRGCIAFSDTVSYVVVGKYVYKVTLTGATEIGQIENALTPVVMETNGTSILLVTGAERYVINTTTDTVSAHSPAIGFAGADRVGFCKGSLVFNEPGTGKFWITDPYSTNVDPLNFATAEGSPDSLISLIIDHEEVWLFGSRTTEVWGYTGDTVNFPFSRITGAFIEVGCAAKHSVAKMDNSVIWLTANELGQGMVYRAKGYSGERISTHGVEQKIASFSRIDDAIAYTYQIDGHTFYQLTFPTGDWTCVYDASTGEWHERSFLFENGREGRHRSNCQMFFNRKNVVGDFQNGQLYFQDPTYYRDGEYQIKRKRISGHVFKPDGTAKVVHANLAIDMERGVGINTGQGVDPVLELSWSDDGGKTWSNPKFKSIGPMGKNKERVRFTRLGSSNDRVYQLTISDPVKVAIYGAYLNE